MEPLQWHPVIFLQLNCAIFGFGATRTTRVVCVILSTNRLQSDGNGVASHTYFQVPLTSALQGFLGLGLKMLRAVTRDFDFSIPIF